MTESQCGVVILESEPPFSGAAYPGSSGRSGAASQYHEPSALLVLDPGSALGRRASFVQDDGACVRDLWFRVL